MKKKAFQRKQTAAQVIGAELRQSRRAGEYTQVVLSKRLGISQSTLSKIESGQLMLGLMEFERAAKLFPKLRALPSQLAG